MISKKLKILVVIPGERDGVSMVFSRRQIESLPKVIDTKIFYLTSRTSLSQLFSESIRFRKEIKEFEPDIIHSHFGTMTSFFCAVNSNKPLIITFHGSDLNKTVSDGYLRDFIGRFLSHISSLKAEMLICVSKRLQEKLIFSRKKSIVIPMGVDIDKFYPMNKNEARNILNWDLGEKVILFNGRDPLVKRNDLAIAALGHVRKYIQNVRLEILSGELNPELMPVYINAADCLLLCSNTEGSPVIIKEALACNLPIVSTDVGDVKERIDNLEGTMLVKQDVESISNGLVNILTNFKESNGRNRIFQDELSEKQISERLIKVYEKVYLRNKA